MVVGLGQLAPPGNGAHGSCHTVPHHTYATDGDVIASLTTISMCLTSPGTLSELSLPSKLSWSHHGFIVSWGAVGRMGGCVSALHLALLSMASSALGILSEERIKA